MISNSGTSTLGLYDFKRQIDAFVGVDYFRPSMVGGYLPNARVMLANGEIVQNGTDGNLTNDPNTDMTGWKDLRSTLGLGNAAFKNTGTQAGNVMEVGAFGLRKYLEDFYDWGLSTGVTAGGVNLALTLLKSETEGSTLILPTINAYDPLFRSRKSTNQAEWSDYYIFYTTRNTIKDSNGFLKGASPVIKLFAEKIEPNEEALEQEPLFEKVDVGHYLLKNTEGFSDNGWYIEMPKDANGNVLVAVQYQQLEDNTIEFKTFAKKFDEETGDIVPNLEKPRDIPVGRWIDIRLKALPPIEYEIPASKTPADFQPTGVAQAVSEMMNGTKQVGVAL